MPSSRPPRRAIGRRALFSADLLAREARLHGAAVRAMRQQLRAHDARLDVPPIHAPALVQILGEDDGHAD
jgi:hypothetical protein